MIAGLPVGNPDDDDEDEVTPGVEYPRITVTLELTIDPNKYRAREVAQDGGPEEFARGLVAAAMSDDGGEMYLEEYCEEWKITKVGPWTGIPE